MSMNTIYNYEYVSKEMFIVIIKIYEPGELGRYCDWLRDGRPGFDFRQGQEILLYSTASKPALGPTRPPIQLVLGVLSPAVKRLWREADYSPPSSVKGKNGGAISLFPIRRHGVMLK
jgi:hypothetical protein